MFDRSEHVGWRRYALPIGLVLVLESVLAACVFFSPVPSPPPASKDKNRSYVAVVHRSVSLPKAAVVPSEPTFETKQLQPLPADTPVPKSLQVASVEKVTPETSRRAVTRVP